MTWIGRSCLGAISAIGMLSLLVSRAGAWGALAVWTDPPEPTVVVGTAGTASVTIIVIDKASEDEAKNEALQACRTWASRCALVGAFQNQCVATAGLGWAIAADEQKAREQATEKCLATMKLNDRGLCYAPNVQCDGK